MVGSLGTLHNICQSWLGHQFWYLMVWCCSLKGNQLCTAFIAPSNLAPFLIPFVKTLLISIRNFLQNGFLIGQVLAEL